MTSEGKRPEGFPLSEEELRELRRYRLEDLMQGRMTSIFSEWLLKGGLGNQTGPEAIIAVFPTPVKGGLA